MNLANRARSHAERTAFNALLAPLRWLLAAVVAPLVVLADPGPRFESGGSKAAYPAGRSVQFTVGAALWPLIPAAAASFGAGAVWVSALALVAALILTRRLTHLAGSRVRALTPAIKARPVLALAFMPAAGLAVAVAFLDSEFLTLVIVTASAGAAGAIAAQVLMRGAARAEQAARLIFETLTVVFKVPEDVARATLRRARQGTYTLSPVPAAARAAASNPADLDAKLAAVLPGHEAVLDLAADRLTIRPASEATLERRRHVAESNGLVVGVSENEADIELVLAPGISPTSAERVEAWGHATYGENFTLIEWDPAHRTGRLRALSDAETQVRLRLAQVLKISRPYDLECEVVEAEGRIDMITLTRVPAGIGGVTPAARREFWKDVVQSLPSGTNGWAVDENSMGAITLTWGPARALPALVPLASILPERVTAEDWARLPLGVNEQGGQAAFDLRLGPHGLFVGPTGSGKTIALNAIILGQLARGHQVVIVDAVKRGVDFRSLVPFLSGFASDMSAATAMLEAVYAEGQRRIDVLEEYGAVKWDDLSEAVREAENVHPLSVIIDEVGSMLVPIKVPSSLPKDDPRREELEEMQRAKDVALMVIGKIARELRFVGVHLALAAQRPDAAILSGELRSNLSSVAQLARPGKLPKREAIAMVFDGDDTAVVAETLTALDDGHSRGLAVIAGDGGAVEGLRVAYAAAAELPGLLDQIGVPRNPPQLAMAAPSASAAAGRAAFGSVISETPVDVEELDLGDLDLDGLTVDDLIAVAADAAAKDDPFADLFEESAA